MKRKFGDAALRQAQAFMRQAANRATIAARQAGKAYKAKDCVRAGQSIDKAWVAVGEGKAYLHSVGMQTHPALYTAWRKLRSVDSLFERTCVRKEPVR